MAFPAIVNKPTPILVGEAGAEPVSVTPMNKVSTSRSFVEGGFSSSSNESSKIIEQNEAIISLLGKISMQRSSAEVESNLYVDGQRMVRVTSRHLETTSYGDR